MATYRFGCTALTGDKADWLVQSASKATEAQEALALDNVGEPVDVHYYQKVQTMQFEVIIPNESSESDIPAVGDIFSYDGKSWYVASSSLSETNTDYNKYQLQCKRFVSANLPL